MNRRTAIAIVAVLLAVIAIGLGQLSTVRAEKPGCPVPDPSIPIPFYIDPVKCKGCEYVNEVAAEAAGWDLSAPYCKFVNPR
jgi:hypothetical protein